MYPYTYIYYLYSDCKENRVKIEQWADIKQNQTTATTTTTTTTTKKRIKKAIWDDLENCCQVIEVREMFLVSKYLDPRKRRPNWMSMLNSSCWLISPYCVQSTMSCVLKLLLVIALEGCQLWSCICQKHFIGNQESKQLSVLAYKFA